MCSLECEEQLHLWPRSLDRLRVEPQVPVRVCGAAPALAYNHGRNHGELSQQRGADIAAKQRPMRNQWESQVGT
jgi:hypothetical protein